jgi:monomeric isocitrate dehydrogenase
MFYIARTPRQVRNKGEEAIKWDSIGDFMKTPESIEAYTKAGEDFHKVFKNIDLDLKENI